MNQVRFKKTLAEPESELLRLQRENSAFRAEIARYRKVETELEVTAENLSIHQEELRTQNELLRQAQQELEESRHQYVDLFEAAPIGYFILDHHGKVLKVNNKGANLLGYSRDYLLGKPRLPYLTQPKREAFSGHLGSISREVPSASAGVDCLHSSRRVVHAKFESVLIDGKRGIPRFQTSLIDISERKQAEETLLRTERRLCQTHKMEAIGTLIGSHETVGHR